VSPQDKTGLVYDAMKLPAEEASATCLRIGLGELTIAICRILLLSKRSKGEVNDLAMGCG
jgi:hypothetical protein